MTRIGQYISNHSSSSSKNYGYELLHEGAQITRGLKYVLRSDVMYGPLATR